MNRFYCQNLTAVAAKLETMEDFSAGQHIVTLQADEAHHARRVLRLNVGDAVSLFDGQGVTAEARIVDWQGGATLSLTAMRRDEPTKPWVVLAVAVPKGARAEDMVNQLAQVGADVLIPISTERSVVDPRDKKLAKFQRIAIEAAKQCGRSFLMEVRQVQPVGEVLAEYAVANALTTQRLIAAPGSADTKVQADGSVETVVVLIGPEGGWTERELESARGAGFAAWCLGPYVMRIETAAVVAAAIVRHVMMP